jgi:cellulose synthase/poly-beta-1,6-N-acetylglucosamine synthase-like glycosyltransferase
MPTNLYSILLVVISSSLTLQGMVAVWQMIYGWLDPEKLSRSQMPRQQLAPKTRFSLIVPCRHEEAVIGDTLKQLTKQSYPGDLFEILVPMSVDDGGTIARVKEVIVANPKTTIRAVLFNGGPINKPHGLNAALAKATGDYIAVFDAEDEVHPRLLEFMNTLILQEGRKILQTSVSLVNWRSSLLTLHAALEYHFWFNSRLHWYADKGAITLGGVGIFLPREVLESLKGWDERFLTEDAKLGIDCSVAGYPFRVVSEEEFATKEEVPVKLVGFMKQRTRWIQGFLQILLDGGWMNLPGRKKIYFLALASFPFFQFLLYLWTAYSIFFAPKLPMILVMFSVLPMGILLFQLVIELGQMAEMLATRRQLRFLPLAFIFFVVSLVPYQMVMGLSAARALAREILGKHSWEKTSHLNTHRTETVSVLPSATEIIYG